MNDLIDRQTLLQALCNEDGAQHEYCYPCKTVLDVVNAQPPAQPTQSNTPNALTALDCISRQAAIDVIVAWTVEDRPDVEMPTDLVDRIANLPSAQPEIIHCRDCEKYGTKFCAIDIWTDEVTLRRVTSDDFCSWAERRTDG